MLTNDQIAVFENLLKDEGFQGKKQLKHLLWLNTSTPEFEIGECFIVSDPGHRIGGFPVKDFNAKITKISSWRDDERWFYTLEACVEINGKNITTEIHKYEPDLLQSKTCEDNVNVLS